MIAWSEAATAVALDALLPSLALGSETTSTCWVWKICSGCVMLILAPEKEPRKPLAVAVVQVPALRSGGGIDSGSSFVAKVRFRSS